MFFHSSKNPEKTSIYHKFHEILGSTTVFNIDDNNNNNNNNDDDDDTIFEHQTTY